MGLGKRGWRSAKEGGRKNLGKHCRFLIDLRWVGRCFDRRLDGPCAGFIEVIILGLNIFLLVSHWP